MCHRRQPLDCINHPAEYLQCTQLVPTGRLDCAVGYEYESWTSEGIVCEPACQCHSRSQWTCQSKCPLSLTASQYSWLAVVLRPLADRSTSRDTRCHSKGLSPWVNSQSGSLWVNTHSGSITDAKSGTNLAQYWAKPRKLLTSDTVAGGSTFRMALTFESSMCRPSPDCSCPT